jgi:hypothetical protein
MSALAIIAGVAIVAWGIIVILVGADVLHFEAGALATAGAVLVSLVGKVRGKKKKGDDGEHGFACVRVLALVAVVAALLMLGACTTTYTGATSRTALQAHGTSGTTAVLDVDGSEVCRVTGTRSTLRVDASTAQRICAAFAPQCTWRAP